jgi:hypothetical protein
MSGGVVTSKEKERSCEEKIQRERPVTTETIADEAKLPARNCSTITISKMKPVTLTLS